MKTTLTIEASPAVIAVILANLPNVVSTPTGTGIAEIPVPGPSAPNMAAPIPLAPSLPTMPPLIVPSDAEDDETGPAAEGTPDVDSTGLRWDERIHSAGKNRLNADGTWRKRRGVDAGLVTQVETELRGAQQQPAPVPMPMPVETPQPVAPPMPVEPLAGPAAVPGGMPAIPPLAPAPTVPMPGSVAAPAVAAAAVALDPGAIDGAAFMQHIAAKMQQPDPATGAPVIHADYLAQITTEIGTAFGQPLNAITDILPHPQMVNYAVQLLKRDGRW